MRLDASALRVGAMGRVHGGVEKMLNETIEFA